MNRKLASITLSAIALAGVGGGAVAALGDDTGGQDRPAAFGQAVTIEIDARDTARQALRGVDVQLVDVNDKVVDTDTTDAAGEAELSVATAGQYRIVAAPPDGYTDRDDTDGNSASTTRVNCTDVFRCTHVDVAATSFSFPFAPNETTAWFEFVPPAATVTEGAEATESAEDELVDDEHAGDGEDTIEISSGRTTRPGKTPPPTSPTTTPSTTAPPVVDDTAAADEAFARGYEDGYVAGFEGIDLYAPVAGYEDDYAEGYMIGSEDGVADQWALQVGDDEAFELGFADGYAAGHEGVDLYFPVAGHEAAYDEGYVIGMETAWAELEAQELPVDEPIDDVVSAEDEAAFWVGYEDGYHEICDPGTAGYAPIAGHEEAYTEGFDTGRYAGEMDCAVG